MNGILGNPGPNAQSRAAEEPELKVEQNQWLKILEVHAQEVLRPVKIVILINVQVNIDLS